MPNLTARLAPAMAGLVGLLVAMLAGPRAVVAAPQSDPTTAQAFNLLPPAKSSQSALIDPRRPAPMGNPSAPAVAQAQANGVKWGQKHSSSWARRRPASPSNQAKPSIPFRQRGILGW